jgi:hypothetical protein
MLDRAGKIKHYLRAGWSKSDIATDATPSDYDLDAACP